MRSMEFIPAILEETHDQFDHYLFEYISHVLRIHVDFADNTLVPSKTLLPDAMSSLPAVVLADAHLMVDRPLLYVSTLAELGFSRIIVHPESRDDVEEVMAAAHSHHMAVALALNPETPIEAVVPYVKDLAFVQVMGIHPGFGGQPMLASTFDKLSLVRESMPNIPIAVDGGVRFETLRPLQKSGATIFIVGHGGLIHEGNAVSGIQRWQKALEKGHALRGS